MTQKKIQSAVSKLLKLMSIVDPKITIKKDSDQASIQIDVSDPQTGALIGYHGETIASLQLILSLVLNQNKDKWLPARINVGDYRQRREATLQDMAVKAADRALQTGQDVILTSLPSNERRLIHMCLSENPQIKTRSEGTNRSRHLIVSPHKSSSE